MAEGDIALRRVFDLLVLGTGLTESIVAAAASKAGKSVLHLDAHDFYGGAYAALPVPQLRELAAGSSAPAAANDSSSPTAETTDAISPGLSAIPAPDATSSARSLIQFHGAPPPLPACLPPGTARRVIVDLLPQLLFARGPTVEVVADSGAANYVEFKTLDGAFVAEPRQDDTLLHRPPTLGGITRPLRQLPASKADVFSAPGLSLSDKRLLMRFLQWAFDHAHAPTMGHRGSDVTQLNEVALGSGRSLLRPQNKGSAGPTAASFTEWSHAPFVDFLAGPCGLPQHLVALALHAIAMVPAAQTQAQEHTHCAPLVSTQDGMEALSRYLRSLGRFPGHGTPLLIPLYGSGEIPQALCRVAAVHGALYMLRAPLRSVLTGPAQWLDDQAALWDSLEQERRTRLGAGPAPSADHPCDAARKEASEPETNERKEGTQGQLETKEGSDGPVDSASNEPLEPMVVGAVTADGTVVRARAVVAGRAYVPEVAVCSTLGNDAAASVAGACWTVLGVCLVISDQPLPLQQAVLGGCSSDSEGTPSPSSSGASLCILPPGTPVACEGAAPCAHDHSVFLLSQGAGTGVVPSSVPVGGGRGGLDGLWLTHVMTQVAVPAAEEGLRATVCEPAGVSDARHRAVAIVENVAQALFTRERSSQQVLCPASDEDVYEQPESHSGGSAALPTDTRPASLWQIGYSYADVRFGEGSSTKAGGLLRNWHTVPGLPSLTLHPTDAVVDAYRIVDAVFGTGIAPIASIPGGEASAPEPGDTTGTQDQHPPSPSLDGASREASGGTRPSSGAAGGDTAAPPPVQQGYTYPEEDGLDVATALALLRGEGDGGILDL